MDNNKYYEAFDWKSFTDADENLKNISEMIPVDVHSIIDVGCGNGLITNKLGAKYDIVGVDRSKAALELVTTKKLEASCDNIPVENTSFDLAMSSELLEHLDDETYRKTLGELNRIAKKYILISVPFEESLSKGIIQCPNCDLLYHRCYHMRTFSADTIRKDFPGFSLVSQRTFGLPVREQNQTIAKTKQKLTKPKNWIPNYMTKGETRMAFCPKCETQFTYPYVFNPIAFFLDSVNLVLTKKKPFHLAVLLKRN